MDSGDRLWAEVRAQGKDLAQACALIVEQRDRISADELQSLYLWAGRNHAPALLANSLLWQGNLDVKRTELGRLVIDAWSMAEFPMLHLDRDLWLELFARGGAGGGYYLSATGRRVRSTPGVKRLYRGSSRAQNLGMSWTDSIRKAEWFAERPHHDGKGRVWALEIETTILLAHIHGPDTRREREWVIDTSHLKPEPL